ncbi:MAG: DoxX family membrane protein [Sphingobacteriaceae bacterium]|nr:DoxX family membrane protein [Sphingobacteriaceae bacterium]
MFVNAGLNKFLNYMPMPQNLPVKMTNMMTAFIETRWLIPLVASIQILGGLFIIIPKTRALGALMIFPIMVGIVFINIFQVSDGLPLAIALSLILLWIMFDSRRKYLQIIR